MRVLKPWTLEILSVTSSALLLIVLVCLLVVFDGKPIFDWRGVTLNAIVSVLSTASKGLLMLGVDEAVGQWKWILFWRQECVVLDFHTVDSASRGPLGSIRLLWKFRGPSMVRIGAVTILLALALDPISQQLIQFRDHTVYVADDKVSIGGAKRYSNGNSFGVQLSHGGFADADFAMQAAVLYGLSHPIHEVIQQLSFDCPSGNCTWERPFDSLAICSKCYNVSASLEEHTDGGALWTSLMQNNGGAMAERDSRAYRLPNGLIIDNLNQFFYSTNDSLSYIGSTLMTAFGTSDPSQTNMMPDVDTLIWAMSILKVHDVRLSDEPVDWPSLPIEAVECGLYYCVNQYQPSISDGKLREDVRSLPAFRDNESWQLLDPTLNYTTLDVTPSQVSSLSFNNTVVYLDHSNLRLYVAGENGQNIYFNVSQNAVNSISSFFQNTFAGEKRTFNQSADGSLDMVVPGQLNGFYMTNGQTQYEPSVMQVLWNTSDIPALFEAVARSMTNVVRDGADPGPPSRHMGLVGVPVTSYEVEWAWITLHFAILLTGLVFMVRTIMAGMRKGPLRDPAPVWKTSALANLVFGAQVGRPFADVNTLDEMKEIAARQRAKLLKSGGVTPDPGSTSASIIRQLDC
ncbi:uncharacterized protein JN550_008161 [Neoarthrinium moseri]|uniref:uncharacterized protein n=1 Tax=Neoarthrinium moseri TaxID=1658444 RepID=UPI001FDB93DD|nr:uncharacterized protein JN550_008161 [Neoarthrinium moseri]KAI1865903.1 hypothetical protein JN550_008161 [Neoarthrinium moseri]